VHRQAAGFIVNNYQDVDKYHPIGAKLSTVDKSAVRVDSGGSGGEAADGDSTSSSAAAAAAGTDGGTAEGTAAPKPEEKKFGDQLDWWQEIGRWRGG
jgi:hypothetical protein